VISYQQTNNLLASIVSGDLKRQADKRLKRQMNEPTYTLAEVKAYLEGWLFGACWKDSTPSEFQNNDALYRAIRNLDDEQDGLAAVTERNKE